MRMINATYDKIYYAAFGCPSGADSYVGSRIGDKPFDAVNAEVVDRIMPQIIRPPVIESAVVEVERTDWLRKRKAKKD